MNELEPKDFATRNVAFGISVFALVNCAFPAFADRLGDPIWFRVLAIALGTICGVWVVLHQTLLKKLEYTIWFLVTAWVIYAANVAVTAPLIRSAFSNL